MLMEDTWIYQLILTADWLVFMYILQAMSILLDFLVTVKAAPHECVIRTGQS